MYKMSDEEFYQVYGRMPRKNKNKKKKVKVYWGRISIALVAIILIIVVIVKIVGAVSGKSQKGKGEKAGVTSSAENKGDDYYAAPENKENDVVYDGIELTVCIDAAHGGIDKGAVGEDGRLEKDDTLKIAEALKKYLEGCGVNVIMTRTDDSFVSVEDRCMKANEAGADIFVSIHRSSTEIEDVDSHGFEAWIHSSRPEADKVFAKNIMSKLFEIGISDNRGVRAGYPDDSNANYPVNDLTEMPSVLLDMGYVTSSIDNQLMDANLEPYARAIGNAIISGANELGVTDSNGARLLNGQLLSNKPAPAEKSAVTESKPDESSGIDEGSSQTEEEGYSYDDGYGYDDYDDTQTESVPEIVYTDDGMGYYTDPMTTE
ncbi:MAG: N-acetylmuramoyl-L-alanine amidase [Ruminococcus sp.]|uniref:N-acetylmuramoyl-L-alanine amidase family protein n=1 Tax=Ruminococcus sp. TaxID=41978 RepID=UPI0025ECB8A0|nr:N-acetylmuramoyl-L-alanine amidase [Ruminococcus sp.]MBO4865041.1 N-acetylmuramoyl-L-alanine amidase [Ruminococcus sp.]